MDPYAVLGVDLFATDAEIVRAFRRLALLHHPDRNGGSTDSAARFREVKAAYDTLRRGRPAHRAPAAPPSEPRAATEPVDHEAGWTSRAVEPKPVERVRARLAKLNDAIIATLAEVTAANVDAIIDAARWTRLDVDSALALKGHVADLRDGHWTTLRYENRRVAVATLAAFLETAIPTRDLKALRNLRARLDGLLPVARGLAQELARA